MSQANLVELTTAITAAFLENNRVEADTVGSLVIAVHRALVEAETGQVEDVAPETPRPTSSQIRKSITPDALISFEDGRGYRALKRHLSVRGMTPDQYREKWGLPANYPMVAASYSEARSALAKALGLGANGRGRPTKKAPASPAKRGPGRPRKTP